ncbi:MAG: PEP-CTERM sorting domain-containing protein [Verrucomicrobiota bacterium]
MKIILRSLLPTVVFLAMASLSASAAIFNWVGDTSVNADWDDAANWDQPTSPVGGANNFRINSGSTAGLPVIYDNGLTISFDQGNQLGNGVGESGFLQIDNGEIILNSQTTNVGNAGVGGIIINNGGVLTKNAGQLNLGDDAGSFGAITINTGGVLNYENLNQNMVIGRNGDGRWNVYGGTVNLSASSTRQYNFGTQAGNGTGVLDIRGGTVQGSDSGRQTVNIGFAAGNGTGRGTLRGYGTVSPIGPTNIGLIQNGGYIIGDGTGPNGAVTGDQSLVLRYTSYTTANNPGGMSFGLYTQNRGAIDLETVNFGGAGNTIWGDSNGGAGDWDPGSPTTVQVNSVFLSVSSGSNSRQADISLLDPTRATDIDGNPLLVNDTGDTFMNIWQVNAADLDGEASVDVSVFSVRYDETFSDFNSARVLGDPYTLYYWDGTVDGEWINLSADVTIDTTNFIAQWESDSIGPFTILDGESGYFALAAIPEPSSVSLVIGAAALLLLRRRWK